MLILDKFLKFIAAITLVLCSLTTVSVFFGTVLKVPVLLTLASFFAGGVIVGLCIACIMGAICIVVDF